MLSHISTLYFQHIFLILYQCGNYSDIEIHQIVRKEEYRCVSETIWQILRKDWRAYNKINFNFIIETNQLRIVSYIQ